MLNISANRDSYLIENGSPINSATYLANQLVSKINNEELLPEIVPRDIVMVKKRIPTTRTIYELNGEEINPIDILVEKRAVEHSKMDQFKSGLKNKLDKLKKYNSLLVAKQNAAQADSKVPGFATMLKRREHSLNNAKRIVSSGSFQSVIINDERQQEKNKIPESEQPVKTYGEVLREYYMYYFGGAAETNVSKKNRVTITMDRQTSHGKTTLKKVYKKSRKGSLTLIDVIEQFDDSKKQKSSSPWFASWLF